MKPKERLRENMATLPTLEHLTERLAAGWTLAAIEWERESAASALPTSPVGGRYPLRSASLR